MIAVVKTGGKQYKVSEGDVIQVEKLNGSVGETINLEEVLICGAMAAMAFNSEVFTSENMGLFLRKMTSCISVSGSFVFDILP